MAQLGEILLLAPGSLFKCGAAFGLTAPAKTDATLRSASYEVEVRAGQRDVVVRFGGASTAAEAYRRGHEFAQEGLDMLSVLGTCDLTIQDAETEYSVWWLENAEVVMRHVSTTLLHFSVGGVVGKALDQDGNEVPQTRPQARHHVAFRYYRLAQASEDLYDAYRNMYLAFEALLSFRSPKQKGEKEIVWLRRALADAQSTLQLHGVVTPSNGVSVVDAVLATIYENARLPLFHAKEGEKVFHPQGSEIDRQKVASALRALTHIVLRMAEAWFDVRRSGGGVFFGWVYDNASQMLDGCTLVATNQPGPPDLCESDLSHERFRSGVRLKTRLAPELRRGKEPAVFGEISGEQLDPLGSVRRFEMVSQGGPLMAQVLESPVTHHGVARVEVLVHVRAMNVNQPKSLFRS